MSMTQRPGNATSRDRLEYSETFLKSGAFTQEEETLRRQIRLVEAAVRANKRNGRAPLPDPIDVLGDEMARRGLSNKDLCPYIGSSGYVCDILHRKKPLSLRMIRNLHQGLGIPAEILIQPYPLQK